MNSEPNRFAPLLLVVLLAAFWLARPWISREMAEAPAPEVTSQASSLSAPAFTELQAELKVRREALERFGVQLRTAAANPNEGLTVPPAKAEEITRKLDQIETQLANPNLDGQRLRHYREEIRELCLDRSLSLRRFLAQGPRADLPEMPDLDRTLVARLTGDAQADEYRRLYQSLQEEVARVSAASQEVYDADLAGRADRLTRVMTLRYRLLQRLADLNWVALFESPGPWLTDCLTEVSGYPDRKYGLFLLARSRLIRHIGGGRAVWVAEAVQFGQAALGLALLMSVLAAADRRDQLRPPGWRGMWTWLAVWPVCQVGLALVSGGLADCLRPIFLLASLFALYRAYLQLARGPLLQTILQSQVGQKVGVRTRALRDLRWLGAALWLQASLDSLMLSVGGPGLLAVTSECLTDLLVKLMYWLLSWNWRVELGEGLAALLPGSPRLGQLVGRLCASPLLGLVLAPLAVPALMVLGFLHWLVRRTVRYDWAKRMSAGVLRRWMEAGRQDNTQLAPVSPAYRQAFQAAEVDSSDYWDDFTPQVEAPVTDWKEGKGANSLMVVHGPNGSGREEVALRLSQRFTGQVEVVQVDVTRRIYRGSELLEVLCRAFGLELQPTSEALLEQLGQRPPTLVVVPAAQRLFLASVGGFEAMDCLRHLMLAARHNHFWCLIMPTQSQRYLRMAIGERWVVPVSLRLPRWTESSLQAMLLQRHSLAGGPLRYSAAVLRAAEATPGVTPETYFFHILRELSGGNPLVARELWLESAHLDSDGTVVVGLPPRKPSHLLVALPAAAGYVLAAVMRHGELTREEAAHVTALPASPLFAAWERCQEIGALGPETGLGLSISRSWRADVEYYLRERNLLDGE